MSYKMLGDKPFKTQYITENKYYNLPTIHVERIILHSTGTGSPRTTQQWRDAWNKSTKNSVSAVVGPDEGIIMLQTFEKTGYGKKCAGCGKGTTGLSFNGSAIQVEMQEYKDIKYTGGASFTTKTPKETSEYQLKVLDTAIQFMANVAIFHNLDVTKPGVLISHHEGHVIWNRCSNHGDCDHLFNQLPDMNMNMDKVRELVAERVKEYKREKEMEEFIMSLKNQDLFDQYMDDYLARKGKLAVSTWAKEDMNWGVDNEIVAGSLKDSRPQSFVTREETIAFLHRYATKLDGKK